MTIGELLWSTKEEDKENVLLSGILVDEPFSLADLEMLIDAGEDCEKLVEEIMNSEAVLYKS